MAVPIRRLYRFVVGFLLGRDVFGTQFSRPVLGCAWAYSVAAVLQSSTATADCYSCTGQESNQKSGSQLSKRVFSCVLLSITAESARSGCKGLFSEGAAVTR